MKKKREIQYILHELKITGNKKYLSGVFTVTAGGGDVIVNLPFDWTGGYLKVYASKNLTEWCNQTNGEYRVDASYDSLTNAVYTVTSVLNHSAAAPPRHRLSLASARGLTGYPRSATTTSVTFFDDGVDTEHVKYFIFT